MASVEKRVRNGQVTWLARWRDPDGAQRKKTFPRRVDADRHIVAVESSKLRGEYVDLTQARRITVVEQARRWAEARPHGVTTARRVESIIDNHLVGTRLGAMSLAVVRPSDVQAWAAQRAKVLSPGSLKLVVGVLRGSLRAAVDDRIIVSNPAAVRIAVPRVQAPRLVPLTVSQVQRLAETVPARCRAMVVTQAGLGLRIGELLALRVEDVDFTGMTVRIEWQLAKLTRARIRPKTPRSIRTVPMPRVVADALTAHMAEFPPGPEGALFTTRSGTLHWHEHYGTRVLTVAARSLGLPEGTSSHDLRHHYASVLLAAGESVVAVAERLGHEDASLVLSTYGHLMPGSDDRTRRAIDVAWCAPTVPPLTVVAV